MSKAHIKASRKYNEKSYDRIEVKVKKGERERIRDAAASCGKSVNSYIVDLIYEDDAMKKGGEQ